MKFFDRLRERFQRKQEEVQPALPPGSVWHIWRHPWAYNRATRRSVGYRKPVGLLPPELAAITPQDPTTMVPRYARRHREALLAPRTRRNRRHVNRIMRSVDDFIALERTEA